MLDDRQTGPAPPFAAVRDVKRQYEGRGSMPVPVSSPRSAQHRPRRALTVTDLPGCEPDRVVDEITDRLSSRPGRHGSAAGRDIERSKRARSAWWPKHSTHCLSSRAADLDKHHRRSTGFQPRVEGSRRAERAIDLTVHATEKLIADSG
jgi:hypothetical protein